MLPSVRANFNSSPFIAHFHTLFLVFFESPFFGFRRRSRDHIAKLPTIVERLIYYIHCFARCFCHLEFQFEKYPAYIRIILLTAFI